MKNKITYEVFDDYVKGTTQNGESFIIDKDDYEFVSNISWHHDKDGYFRNRKLGFMHRLINKTIDGRQTDHINRDKTDNRKCNLRNATHIENQENKGYIAERGINKNHNCNTWTAHLWNKKKRYYIGSFKTREEAVEARRKFIADNNLQ